MTCTSLDLCERRNQLRRMLSSVIGQQIEIVFSSELALRCNEALAGFVSPQLPAMVCERLPEQVFTRSAHTLAINDDWLRGSAVSASVAALWFDAVALHEAAHIVSSVIRGESADVPADGLADLVAENPATWNGTAGKPPWAGHDLRFLRALLHVDRRLSNRGHRTALNLAFNHARYGLSSAETYRDALADELKNDWRPLGEVLTAPIPNAFCDLWGRDVRALLTV